MKLSTPVLQILQFQEVWVPDLNHRHFRGFWGPRPAIPCLAPSRLRHFLLKPPSLQGGSSWSLPRTRAHTHTLPPYTAFLSLPCAPGLGGPGARAEHRAAKGAVRPVSLPTGTFRGERGLKRLIYQTDARTLLPLRIHARNPVGQQPVHKVRQMPADTWHCTRALLPLPPPGLPASGPTRCCLLSRPRGEVICNGAWKEKNANNLSLQDPSQALVLEHGMERGAQEENESWENY